jgi:hypothetical protein
MPKLRLGKARFFVPQKHRKALFSDLEFFGKAFCGWRREQRV